MESKKLQYVQKLKENLYILDKIFIPSLVHSDINQARLMVKRLEIIQEIGNSDKNNYSIINSTLDWECKCEGIRMIMIINVGIINHLLDFGRRSCAWSSQPWAGSS